MNTATFPRATGTGSGFFATTVFFFGVLLLRAAGLALRAVLIFEVPVFDDADADSDVRISTSTSRIDRDPGTRTWTSIIACLAPRLKGALRCVCLRPP